MFKKPGQVISTIFKLIIITFFLGLGVHYGFLLPKGEHGLESAGIFSNSSNSVVVTALSFYAIYRVLWNSIKWIRIRKIKEYDVLIAKQKRFVFLQLLVYEPVLALITIPPIALGIYWSKNEFFSNRLPFSGFATCLPNL
jgi:hypothetical protein